MSVVLALMVHLVLIKICFTSSKGGSGVVEFCLFLIQVCPKSIFLYYTDPLTSLAVTVKVSLGLVSRCSSRFRKRAGTGHHLWVLP
jgi:hypothetical protein